MSSTRSLRLLYFLHRTYYDDHRGHHDGRAGHVGRAGRGRHDGRAGHVGRDDRGRSGGSEERARAKVKPSATDGSAVKGSECAGKDREMGWTKARCTESSMPRA